VPFPQPLLHVGLELTLGPLPLADSAPAEEHMAAVLSKLGFMSNVQQVYLAGVHPEHGISNVVEQQPDSSAQLAEAFVDQVMPKINLCVSSPHLLRLVFTY